MSTVCLDTNVLIDYLRNVDEASGFLENLSKRPAASVITITELIVGAKSSRDELRIARLEDIVLFLPVTLEIARRAGQFTKHYRASHGIDDADALIAATAEQHKLPLATLNVKHFPMFPKLKRAY